MADDVNYVYFVMYIKQLISCFFYLFTAHPVVLRHLKGDRKILS